MRIIKFWEEAHIGDAALAIMGIKRLLEYYDDIVAEFYCSTITMTALYDLYVNYRFIMIDNTHIPMDSTMVRTWAGSTDKHSYRSIQSNCNYVYGVMEHLNDRFEEIGYCRCITSMDNFRFDFDSIKYSSWFDYNDIDVLLVNSLPRSGQVDYIPEMFNTFINNNKHKYKIAITKHIDGIDGVFSTEQHNLSLMDIGALSNKCKYVIGINTSPVLFTNNIWSDKKHYFICVVNYDSSMSSNSLTYRQLTSTTQLQDIIL